MKLSNVIGRYKMFRRNTNQPAGAAVTEFMEYCFYRVLYGSGFPSILSYDFIGFRYLMAQRIWKTMFERESNARLLALINDEEQLPVLRNKHRLLGRMDDLGRRFLYIPDHTEDRAYRFFREAGTCRYILKPDSEAFGRGISFLYVEEDTFTIEGTEERYQGRDGFHVLYDRLKQKNILAEEYIKQHEEMNNLFSNCVNTLRIHTVFLPSGHAETAGFSSMICGWGNSRHSNEVKNIRIGINPDGTLFPCGFLQTCDAYGYKHISQATRHPDTGILFEKFRIPYWKEALKLAESTAEKVPELTYIGWDIAISEAGPVIVEGNGMPASYWTCQAYSILQRNRGIKKEYSEFLKTVIFLKTLTPERIQEINRNLSRYGESCDPRECDTVVVLGSTRCTSRIEKAFSVFRGNEKTRYILCGGLESEHPKSLADPNEGMLTEAEYMKRYLLERNIAKERIFVDNTSTNTWENISCAVELMQKIGTQKAAVVSAWFHGRRVLELIDRAKLPGTSVADICFLPACGQQTSPENWYRSLYGIHAIRHELEGN